MTDCPPNGRGQGHVTVFNFPPIISLELLKLGTSNLVGTGVLVHTIYYPQTGYVQSHVTFLNFGKCDLSNGATTNALEGHFRCLKAF